MSTPKRLAKARIITDAMPVALFASIARYLTLLEWTRVIQTHWSARVAWIYSPDELVVRDPHAATVHPRCSLWRTRSRVLCMSEPVENAHLALIDANMQHLRHLSAKIACMDSTHLLRAPLVCLPWLRSLHVDNSVLTVPMDLSSDALPTLVELDLQNFAVGQAAMLPATLTALTVREYALQLAECDWRRLTRLALRKFSTRLVGNAESATHLRAWRHTLTVLRVRRLSSQLHEMLREMTALHTFSLDCATQSWDMPSSVAIDIARTICSSASINTLADLSLSNLIDLHGVFASLSDMRLSRLALSRISVGALDPVILDEWSTHMTHRPPVLVLQSMRLNARALRSLAASQTLVDLSLLSCSWPTEDEAPAIKEFAQMSQLHSLCLLDTALSVVSFANLASSLPLLTHLGMPNLTGASVPQKLDSLRVFGATLESLELGIFEDYRHIYYRGLTQRLPGILSKATALGEMVANTLASEQFPRLRKLSGEENCMRSLQAQCSCTTNVRASLLRVLPPAISLVERKNAFSV